MALIWLLWLLFGSGLALQLSWEVSNLTSGLNVDGNPSTDSLKGRRRGNDDNSTKDLDANFDTDVATGWCDDLACKLIVTSSANTKNPASRDVLNFARGLYDDDVVGFGLLEHFDDSEYFGRSELYGFIRGAFNFNRNLKNDKLNAGKGLFKRKVSAVVAVVGLGMEKTVVVGDELGFHSCKTHHVLHKRTLMLTSSFCSSSWPSASAAVPVMLARVAPAFVFGSPVRGSGAFSRSATRSPLLSGFLCFGSRHAATATSSSML
jgi:hypothetical protein